MSKTKPSSQESLIASVIAEAGGTMTGRVRLQKVIYLLDQLNLRSGFTYEYHHYGPYSKELTVCTEAAKADGLISEEFDVRQGDGAWFSRFKTAAHFVTPLSLPSNTRTALAAMNSTNATVLELAATAYWIRHSEKRNDWRKEIKRRKGVKTEDGRLEQALRLLDQLRLNLS